MIDEPAIRPAISRSPLKEETTMLKTISAALLAVCVVAAPVMAAGSSNHASACRKRGAGEAEGGRAGEAERAECQCENGPPSCQACRHHRAHKKVSAVKTHQSSKAMIKQAPATKRG